LQITIISSNLVGTLHSF